MREQKHLNILAVSVAFLIQSQSTNAQPAPPGPPDMARPGLENLDGPLPESPSARRPGLKIRPGTERAEDPLSDTSGTRPPALKPRPEIDGPEGPEIDGPGRDKRRNGAAVDEDNLISVHGRVKEYLLNPKGEVRGVLLSDGSQVQCRPHLQPVLNQLKIGQKIVAQGNGVKSKLGTCLEAVKIDIDENSNK